MRLNETTLNLYTHTWFFSCLSIASVDSKQHFSEVGFGALLRFSLQGKWWNSTLGPDFLTRNLSPVKQRTWFRFFNKKPESCGSRSSLLSWYQEILPKTSESSAQFLLFHQFPYNENPTRALNITSLKFCLPSNDAIDRWEEIHAGVWRFNVAYRKRVSLKFNRFSQKKSDIFLTE